MLCILVIFHFSKKNQKKKCPLTIGHGSRFTVHRGHLFFFEWFNCFPFVFIYFLSQQIEISVRKLADARIKTKEFGDDHFVCNSCDPNFDTIVNDADTEINMDSMTQQQSSQQKDDLTTSNRTQPTPAGKSYHHNVYNFRWSCSFHAIFVT